MDNDNPLLVDTGRGFSIYYKKRHLYSIRQPKDAAEKKSTLKHILPGTIIFVPSPLLFYGIDTLIKRLPHDTLVIALELDPKLSALCNDCFPADPRLVFIQGDSELVFKILTDRGIWRFRRVELLTLSGGYTLHKEKYSQIHRSLSEAVQEYWQNRITMIHMGPLWIKNIFLNMEILSRRKTSDICWNFSNRAGSRPVLVAGAGESLEYSIEEIKRHRQRFLLLAVDTALPALQAHSIIPDFIVAVDAQIYNLYDIHGYKHSSIPLFYDITCYPGIVRNFRGQLLPFLSSFSKLSFVSRLIKEFPSLHILPALGSVGITALYLANQLTGGPVLYTGLDFSYSIGKSHARGTPSHLHELFSSDRLTPAGSIDQFFTRPSSILTGKTGPTRTNPILLSYAALVKKYYKTDRRVFDIGKTGIKLTENRAKSITDILDRDYHDKAFDITPVISLNPCLFNSFILGEKKRLKTLYSGLYLWLSEGKGESEQLLSLLKDEDFLYLHFPDQSPEPKLEPNYLKRILVSASHYLKILENISVTFQNRKEC